MRHFVVGAYDRDLDCRDWSRLASAWRRPHDDAAFRAIIAPRRAGKTWALRGLEAAIGESARYLDLREDALPTDPERRVWLLDEPGWLLGDGPVDRLVEWLKGRRQRGDSVLFALTPTEYERLATCFRGRRPPDPQILPALDDREQARLAGHRAEVLAQVPKTWRVRPFLLTLLLGALGDGPPDLSGIEAAAAHAAGMALNEHHYLREVLEESLPGPLRIGLLATARGRAPAGDVSKKLSDLGLIARDGAGSWRVEDPVLAARLGQAFRIHHLSDLHFGPKTAEAVDRKDPTPMGGTIARAAGQGPIRDQYLARLREGRAPHVVIVSGDLAEHGTEAQLDEAGAWLREVEATLPGHPELDRDATRRVLLVGGNHDVRWDLADKGLARHETFQSAVGEWPTPRLHVAPDSRGLARVHFRGADIDVILLGSAELGGEQDAWMKLAVPSVLRSVRRAGIPLSADDEKALEGRLLRADPGLVHHRQVEALRALPKEAALRIVVLHHPVASMPVAVEVSPFSGLVNAGQVLAACFAAKVDLVLHGHVHSAWFSEQQWPGVAGEHRVRVASAATLGSRETFAQHGYNEIDVLYEGDRVLWWIRPVVYEGGMWKEQAEIGPFEARSG